MRSHSSDFCWLIFAALLLTAACRQPDASVSQPANAGEWHKFEGTWTATGTRRTVRLRADERAAIFELTGSVLLTGAERPAVGFRAQAIGFSDSRTGMQGRCIWTDERGEMVYSELKGEFVGTGKHITGTFIGGTGRYAGMSGEYSFQWQYVIDIEDGGVSGRAVNFKGAARLSDGNTASMEGPGA